jgi:hypothetical protein
VPGEKLIFDTKTTEITIDYNRCEPAMKNTATPSCGFACVKGCRLYGRNILKIEKNRPVLAIAEPEEIKRLDNECMSCEHGCLTYGTGCISITVPVPGLEEYREKAGRGKSS